jgi:hypothetical protein
MQANLVLEFVWNLVGWDGTVPDQLEEPNATLRRNIVYLKHKAPALVGRAHGSRRPGDSDYLGQ